MRQNRLFQIASRFCTVVVMLWLCLRRDEVPHSVELLHWLSCCGCFGLFHVVSSRMYGCQVI